MISPIELVINHYPQEFSMKSNVDFIIIPTELYPPTTKLLGGILVSLHPSVRPSVRLSRLPCPLCNIYSSGWILSILATNDHYHERVCRTQWPLTFTYIFKVIQPWLRKSCPLCSVYSSGWIIFYIYTNDHYIRGCVACNRNKQIDISMSIITTLHQIWNKLYVVFHKDQFWDLYCFYYT